MSHEVVRGSPTAFQLAFDELLDAVVEGRAGARGAGAQGAGAQGAGAQGAGARARLSLPQVLYHCLKTHPQDLFMINADTDEKTTNQQLLSQVIALAHKLLSRGVKGKVVVLVHDTHRTMVAVYFAVMFAGAVPYVMFNENTTLEMTSLLDILQPVLVTCDARYHDIMTSALNQLPDLNPEILLDLEGSADEADVDKFLVPEVDPDETAVMLGTSGTTGLPKSVQLTHRGLVARLPWSFVRPRSDAEPPERVLLSFSSDGVAFLRCGTSCFVARRTLLLPQTLPSADRLRDMLLKYRPGILMVTPLSASALLPLVTADHFSTLRVVFLAGSTYHKNFIAEFKEKLPPTALLLNSYGSTEAQGGIALGTVGEHLQFSNFVNYKIVDDSGKEVKKGETGELYINAPTLAKGYYKIPQHESFEDGWYKTGDLFYEDGEGKMWFVERKAICYKFMGSHVSPEETERVIESIEGVQCCAVMLTEKGSAAAVVASGDVTREMVHNVVKASLSENKWLYGGVAFVPALPRTGLGKLQRKSCRAVLQERIEAGDCY